MTTEELLDLAGKMRTAQRSYYAIPQHDPQKQAYLQEARRLEAEFDKEWKEYKSTR